MTYPLSTIPAATGGNNPYRGICTLEYKGRVVRFRTNPNEVRWSYRLHTAVENTYGGRVIQILGAKIEDLSVIVECGRGGWPYLRQIVSFMRDWINDQRSSDPGTFWYSTRNWRLKVFAHSVPFMDTVTATTRPIELRFKVQEDVSGIQTSMALSYELQRLQDGIGFRKSQYNSSMGGWLNQQQTPNWFSPLSIPGNLLNSGVGNLVTDTLGQIGVPTP